MIGVGRGLLTIGRLVTMLAAEEPTAVVRWDRERKHYYGGGGNHPGYFHSWRGDYSELTLDKREDPITVADLLKRARLALGGDFEGWKGGTYRMDEETPVWGENAGDCDAIGVVGVGHSRDGAVILKTKQVPT